MSKSYVPDWAAAYSIIDQGSSIIVSFWRSDSCVLPASRAYPISELSKHLAIADVCKQIKDRPLEARMVMPKQDRYKVEGSDDDYVDSTYNQMSWERFVGAMQWTIGKYFDRFGRKDDIVSEAYKIKDYANRFYEKALIEAEKRKKVDEVV